FLKGVVDYGTATGTRMDFLEIAGKTGTAEKSIRGKQGYAEEKYTSIFAGFFPVKEPQYVIVIVYDEPDYESYSYYATLSAVPTFRNIVTNMINLPQSDILVSEKEKNKRFITAPDVTGMTREKAIELLNKKKIKYQVQELSTDGNVVNQFPKPGTSYPENEFLIVILDNVSIPKEQNELDYKMPDFTGLTLRKAIALANKKNIKLIIKGNGTIVRQMIQPGSKIKFGEICSVTAK
ncbi:MAG: PASTA domain-containing protein, partial [Candidatus Cloacimonetes bacterium]|nr:PASTA domain-containing protein [Candidatus Cloacimonadota bacterium]